jgi:CxxC motif-containing protein (DUF1111 family)
MNMRKNSLRDGCIALSSLGLVACGAPNDNTEEDVTFARGTNTTTRVAVGGHLQGISDSDFSAAKANFAQVETIADGVGPIFNDVACGNCHDLGAIGGAGLPIERRFGRFDNGIFNPLANEGGSLRQLESVGTFTNVSGQTCTVPVESEPEDATVHNVGRVTTPLFGLGLVDAMPDSFFENLARNEPSGVRGVVNHVSIVLPNPADSSQSVGATRVGRFGWKAGVPTLVQFAADAYLNEMGITTQHCIGGQSITAFSTESAPNGVPVAPGCDDLVPGVDDSVGECASGQTEIQDDVANFNRFMTFLAPAPSTTDPLTQILGTTLFITTGCADCHTTQTFTTPSHPANGVPGGFSFHPYSDFLVHDMGTLGDNIGNAGDSTATTRRMRTAPLWGVRFRTAELLHDGRASDIPSAIAAHDGQGANAARNFRNMPSVTKQTLVNFVLSL